MHRFEFGYDAGVTGSTIDVGAPSAQVQLCHREDQTLLSGRSESVARREESAQLRALQPRDSETMPFRPCRGPSSDRTLD